MRIGMVLCLWAEHPREESIEMDIIKDRRRTTRDDLPEFNGDTIQAP